MNDKIQSFVHEKLENAKFEIVIKKVIPFLQFNQIMNLFCFVTCMNTNISHFWFASLFDNPEKLTTCKEIKTANIYYILSNWRG